MQCRVVSVPWCALTREGDGFRSLLYSLNNKKSPSKTNLKFNRQMPSEIQRKIDKDIQDFSMGFKQISKIKAGRPVYLILFSVYYSLIIPLNPPLSSVILLIKYTDQAEIPI